jgi:hypothetical protein
MGLEAMSYAVGWRCWNITGDGVLWSPLNYGGDVQWEFGRNTAVCERRKRHDVPSGSCECGFRIMTDLAAFIHDCGHGRGCVNVTGRVRWLPKVCGLCSLYGRITGPDSVGDPPETLRGEVAMIRGPLFLGFPFKVAAQKLAERYAVPVVVANVLQGDWIFNGGLLRDLELWNNDRDALEGRLYLP